MDGTAIQREFDSAHYNLKAALGKIAQAQTELEYNLEKERLDERFK